MVWVLLETNALIEQNIFFPFKNEGHQYLTGKDMYSPEAESSPAPSSAEPQLTPHGKNNSRTSSFEIENLLKSAEQVWKLGSDFEFKEKII